MFNLQTKSNST